MPKQILVIYNPTAGTAGLPEMWLGSVVHRLSERDNATVTVKPTKPGIPIEDLIPAGSDCPELVVAAGGDGTIRIVLGAMARSNLTCPVGLIPMGTGNQLARNLGIYQDNILGEPVKEAIKIILDGKPVPVDLGKMNDAYFCVAAGAGPMSDAIVTPEQDDKASWRILAYASSMIQTFALPPVVFQVSTGSETFEIAASGIFVTNIADLGLGKLSNTAHLNDGLLDLCILNPTEFADYLALGFRFAGGFVGGEAPYYIRKVRSVDIDVVPVRSPVSRFQWLSYKIRGMIQQRKGDLPPRHEKVMAMIDGEEWGTTPMHIEVAPQAVRILVPQDFESKIKSGGAEGT